MEYKKIENGIFIYKDEFFKPELTFDCGQSFRFFSVEGKTRVGIAFGSIIEIKEENDGYSVLSYPPLQTEILEEFFDLKRDYREIEKALSKDETLKTAIEFGRGIRILKQDFFETLLTFIYSQRCNIPKIAKCVERTAELFGKELFYNGKKFYAFPTCDDMKNVSEEALESVKCGYRSGYIVDAVKKIQSGELNYENLKALPYEELKAKLMTIRGVGEKVADCVCLFSFGRFEAFPTDTWIKKAMDSLYNVKEADIKSASKDMFGELSGIAQQYLFYYLRYKGENQK